MSVAISEEILYVQKWFRTLDFLFIFQISIKPECPTPDISCSYEVEVLTDYTLFIQCIILAHYFPQMPTT